MSIQALVTTVKNRYSNSRRFRAVVRDQPDKVRAILVWGGLDHVIDTPKYQDVKDEIILQFGLSSF